VAVSNSNTISTCGEVGSGGCGAYAGAPGVGIRSCASVYGSGKVDGGGAVAEFLYRVAGDGDVVIPVIAGGAVGGVTDKCPAEHEVGVVGDGGYLCEVEVVGSPVEVAVDGERIGGRQVSYGEGIYGTVEIVPGGASVGGVGKDIVECALYAGLFDGIVDLYVLISGGRDIEVHEGIFVGVSGADKEVVYSQGVGIIAQDGVDSWDFVEVIDIRALGAVIEDRVPGDGAGLDGEWAYINDACACGNDGIGSIEGSSLIGGIGGKGVGIAVWCAEGVSAVAARCECLVKVPVMEYGGDA
jgi:hypothetical protein